jgi:hypothetical protein
MDSRGRCFEMTDLGLRENPAVGQPIILVFLKLNFKKTRTKARFFQNKERKKIKVNILGAVPLRHVEVLYRRSRILNGTAQQ